MGNVVKGNFGRKSEGNVGQEITDRVQPDFQSKIFREDFLYFLANIDRLTQAFRRGEEITDYVFSLSDFVTHDECLHLRKAALADMSLEDLCAHLLDSSNFQWSKQPHFYGAVLLVLNERCEPIRTFISEGETKE